MTCVHVNRKLFHLVSLGSKKPDLLNTKNQTSNTLEFIQVRNGQTNLLKDCRGRTDRPPQKPILQQGFESQRGRSQ